MKTMKCSQLGGACDLDFHAETFDEIAAISQAHGKEMYEQQDAEHLAAMGKVGEMMKTPGEMEKWLEGKRNEFDALPED
jgi:hypothetical protein